MLATVLGGQGIVIMLGATLARSMAATSGKHSPTLVLTLGLTLGLLCFVAAAGMRRGWGLPLGWGVQALTLASAFVVPMMLAVSAIFLGLWVLSLVKGSAVDVSMAQRT